MCVCSIRHNGCSKHCNAGTGVAQRLGVYCTILSASQCAPPAHSAAFDVSLLLLSIMSAAWRAPLAPPWKCSAWAGSMDYVRYIALPIVSNTFVQLRRTPHQRPLQWCKHWSRRCSFDRGGFRRLTYVVGVQEQGVKAVPHLGGRIEISQSCDERMQTQPVSQQGGEDAEVCSETLQVTTVFINTAIRPWRQARRQLVLAVHCTVGRRRLAVS